MAVKGLDRLKRQIAALPTLQIAAARGSMQEGAEEMANAVKRAAPKRTGRMAEGVEASPVDQARDGSESVKGQAGLAWKVTAPFPAPLVERGTAAAPAGRYQDANGKTRTNKRAHAATRAQPFFWPTIRAFRKRVKSRVIRNANKAAKAAAAVK